MISLNFCQPATREAWAGFTLAVTDAFWLLPSAVRPQGILTAGDLFSGEALVLLHGRHASAGQTLTLSPRAMTSDNLHRDDTAYCSLHLTNAQEDFFARLVMVLLHNLCPGYADIRIAGCRRLGAAADVAASSSSLSGAVRTAAGE